MIHRVFADWMARMRAALDPPVTSTAPEPRDEAMLARLRVFIAARVRHYYVYLMNTYRQRQPRQQP
jgi:hypothetical protein